MDYIYYYNNKLYALFLSVSFVLVCFGITCAENYLIPPGDREVDEVQEYLNNEIEREKLCESLLGSAEEFCLEKIRKKEDVSMYRSQLLKIYFDRIFIRNFNNPVWLEKHIKRDNKRLLIEKDEREREKISKRIEKFTIQLEKLREQRARHDSLKKKSAPEPVAAVTE